MLLLIICIFFNSYISIIFELFARYQIRVSQAIVVNYFVCVLTASVILGKPAVSLATMDKEWFTAAVLIGLTFIITFNLFAQTVQKFGVVIGSIFQKMSLIAPALIAILYFGDSSNPVKIIGILLAIVSISLISISGSSSSTEYNSTSTTKKMSPFAYIFPIGTFVGSCFIDSGLWYVNQSGLASGLDIDFIATLFFVAGCFGLLFVLYDYIKNKTPLSWKDIIAGFALGIPNFFSIWLILKVLSNGMEASVVFPINNVGILITTAILGFIFFNEKFNTKKIIGLLLAVIAIILIALG